MKKVPSEELNRRMGCFRLKMDRSKPDWKVAVIFSKVNQYYFTGTMQDGMIIIPKDDEAVYWVRRSVDRAMEESLFERIEPMGSFRDAAAGYGEMPSVIYMETEIVPLALLRRFRKYFPFDGVEPADKEIAAVRAIKSPYERAMMEQAGKIHRNVLENRLPEVMREGMSEAELAIALYTMMIEEGHHGLSRFGMFDTEMILGNICFGESSIYPTYFNGPGGSLGLSPAVPLFGNRERKLKKGDLVFVDVACGFEGYHTDKTMTYMFGKPLCEEVREIHNQCVEIQNKVASMLKPGAIPDQIYKQTMNELDKGFLKNFMGYQNRQVQFLGHGIGLFVDEHPVIANGFIEPIQEGMAFAVEPKKGIRNVGMVGTENTFWVTPDGGRCITGDHPGMIPVY